MKKNEIVSLIETNIGPIELKTTVLPWWLSYFTFGFFKKILCEIGGPAFQRDREIRKKWCNSLFLSRYCLAADEESLERKEIIYTTESHKYLHECCKKYLQRLALLINRYHEIMQLYLSMEEALANDDDEKANQIYQEIKDKQLKFTEKE